jgi:chitin disaccharide deacetylase
MPKFRPQFSALLAVLLGVASQNTCAATFAERLGYPQGTRVVILHVDDAGMSHQSNIGAMRSVTEGVANSMSVMMPCSWVPELKQMLVKHPDLDVGLHLTLTSEWSGYRWGPLASRDRVPGLIDAEGALWPTVEDVAKRATADEVELEIRAQIARSRDLGIEPTHLDSHMGTLFARDDYLERYIKVGAEEGIPVMFPGGHVSALRAQLSGDVGEEQAAARVVKAQAMAETVWSLGLPVLDDLHNVSYGWTAAEHAGWTDRQLTDFKVSRYLAALRDLQPGVTMMIMHNTDADQNFTHISDSGPTRRGDMLAMLDPRIRQAIINEKIVMTTWREIRQRRRAIHE